MADAIEVKGLGKIYTAERLFDEALKELKEYGVKEPISLRDMAYAIIGAGKKSELSEHGSYVKEGIIYTPKQILFVSDSPIIKSAKQAVECHRDGDEFYLNAKKYQEQAEKDKNKEPEKREVLISKTNKNYNIPTNRFNDEELTLWAFKDKTKGYGEFLKDAGINEMHVYFAGQKEKSFAGQLWLHRAGYCSGLDGGRDLDYGSRVRGVLKETGEATQNLYNKGA